MQHRLYNNNKQTSDKSGSTINKIIWTCWWQGIDQAPYLVKRCIESWFERNPEWEIRIIDSVNVRQYCNLPNLNDRVVTAASLSDILRISLLHEYGGVWIDATLFCNKPLDEWLFDHMDYGFFAFAYPAPTRLISSWFLACFENNLIVNQWYAATFNFWNKNKLTNDYFWFHHLFEKIYQENPNFRNQWNKITKISADGPHLAQRLGLLSSNIQELDLSVPVFKLTYRFDNQFYKPGSILWHILENKSMQKNHFIRQKNKLFSRFSLFRKKNKYPLVFASLKTSTENLGDHIQIISGLNLLKQIDIKPNLWIDRDDEIKTANQLNNIKKVPILMNGWFKINSNQWPPNKNLIPLYFSFHIRLFQCPELISKAALIHYKKWSPIGCRDLYTYELLKNLGVDAFLSHCISLTIYKRKIDSNKQKKTLVISRDQRILEFLPNHLENVEFISHYSSTTNFDENMDKALSLLEYYEQEAKLIITTMLHAAYSAIALGIPVIVFYPINDSKGNSSDKERFSSLVDIVDIYSLQKQQEIDWNGKQINIGILKLFIREKFYEMTKIWNLPNPKSIGPIAPSSILPPPDN